ncbi:MAG: glutaminyl-peptide cyclotransferase [Parahaliea sp.]
MKIKTTLKSTLLWLFLLPLTHQTSLAQTQYSYRVLDQKTQSRANFVQGLQIVDGNLYVSSGGYGESRLLRYSMDSGTLQASQTLNPRLFAEGLTVVDDLIYQLTWRARLLIVWDRRSMSVQKTLPILTEGWGITYNGQQLIYSDGSDRLYFMDPSTGLISHSVQVQLKGQPLARLNELEWIDGKVWANVWLSDMIVIIDPASGVVNGQIDLAGLLPESERKMDTDVLNGIAQDPANGALWVTGKRWPWLYRIELIEKSPPAKQL